MARRALLVAQGAAVGLVALLLGLLVWKLVSNQGGNLARAANRGERPAAPGSSAGARVTKPVVAVLAGLCGLVLAGAAWGAPPRAADLEAELVCPVCKTTLDQSDSPVANRMKAYIRTRIAAGDSAQQIKDALVAQFGPGVLARPPKGGFGLLAWLPPLVAVGVGAVVV